MASPAQTSKEHGRLYGCFMITRHSTRTFRLFQDYSKIRINFSSENHRNAYIIRDYISITKK